MSHFLIKLIPPRPTFFVDMSAAERQVMLEHGGYWKALTERGVAILFGPVLDPAGVWGVAVVEAAGEPQVRELIAGDPVTAAGLGAFQVYPMQVGAIRAGRLEPESASLKAAPSA